MDPRQADGIDVAPGSPGDGGDAIARDNVARGGGMIADERGNRPAGQADRESVAAYPGEDSPARRLWHGFVRLLSWFLSCFMCGSSGLREGNFSEDSGIFAWLRGPHRASAPQSVGDAQSVRTRQYRDEAQVALDELDRLDLARAVDSELRARTAAEWHPLNALARRWPSFLPARSRALAGVDVIDAARADLESRSARLRSAPDPLTVPLLSESLNARNASRGLTNKK